MLPGAAALIGSGLLRVRGPRVSAISLAEFRLRHGDVALPGMEAETNTAMHNKSEGYSWGQVEKLLDVTAGKLKWLITSVAPRVIRNDVAGWPPQRCRLLANLPRCGSTSKWRSDTLLDLVRVTRALTSVYCRSDTHGALSQHSRVPGGCLLSPDSWRGRVPSYSDWRLFQANRLDSPCLPARVCRHSPDEYIQDVGGPSQIVANVWFLVSCKSALGGAIAENNHGSGSTDSFSALSASTADLLPLVPPEVTAYHRPDGAYLAFGPV